MKMRMAFLFLGLLLISFTTADLKSDCLEIYPNMVSYWKFDNDREDTVERYNGEGNNVFAIIENSKVGRAASFDGNQQIAITNGTVPLNFGSSSFTIQFWFDGDESEYIGTLINKTFYGIKYESVYDGEESFYGTLTATVNNIPITAPVSSGWNFVALVVQRPSNISLYVNGTLVNSTFSQNAFTGTASPSSPLIIGQGFNGIIDELAMFNSALSVDIIRANYQRTSGGNSYCSKSGEGFSGTDTTFTVEGCYNINPPLPGGACSSNRESFCLNNSDGTFSLLDTSEANNGCSRGMANNFQGNPCCPNGYNCELVGGKYQCVQKPYDCNAVNSMTDEDKEKACLEIQCFWMVKDGVGTCVYNPSDYSCSFYDNATKCREDVWNLGKEGVGTEVCGTYRVATGMRIGYTIPQDSCRCEWLANEDECTLAWDAIPNIYGLSGKNSFTCQKIFDTSECVDGNQLVNWSAFLTNQEGLFLTPTRINEYDDTLGLSDPRKTSAQQVINVTGCNDGSVTRNCGDSIVKVPGESLFAILASIAIISFVYVFKIKKYE